MKTKTLLSSTALVIALAFSGTAVAHSDWYAKDQEDGTPSAMEHALSKLPAKDAADFRETMKDASEDNKDLRKQLYALYSDLNAIVVAPDFDKRAFLSKRADIQKVYDKMEDNRAEAFASGLAQLTPAERVTLVRNLHNEHKEKKGHFIAHHTVMNKNGSAPVNNENDSIQH